MTSHHCMIHLLRGHSSVQRCNLWYTSTASPRRNATYLAASRLRNTRYGATSPSTNSFKGNESHGACPIGRHGARPCFPPTSSEKGWRFFSTRMTGLATPRLLADAAHMTGTKRPREGFRGSVTGFNRQRTQKEYSETSLRLLLNPLQFQATLTDATRASHF